MKKKNIYFIVLLFCCTILYSCKDECKLSIDTFNDFGGIKRGSSIDDVKKVFGNPLLEEREDRYIRVEYEAESGIPLIFWCNDSTKLVETIRLEVLGLEENLQADIDAANRKYNLNCLGSVLGESRKQIETWLGEPGYSGKEETADYVDYYSDDNKTVVTLKYWYEQKYLMTQLNINWFYE